MALVVVTDTGERTRSSDLQPRYHNPDVTEPWHSEVVVTGHQHFCLTYGPSASLEAWLFKTDKQSLETQKPTENQSLYLWNI